MNSSPPIRSRAAEESSFEIPLWGAPLVVVLIYVCLFSGLSALGLVGPDEPRYAAIARAMADTHDWITPRLWGTPWFEKPALYYWSAGIAMRIFGLGEFAARLPSALAALLAVVAIAWTALRSYGIGAAWFAILMLPSSVALIGFSRAASPDMLFAGLLTAAMAVACDMLQTSRPGSFLRIAFGFLLGAAVLAKGPAAAILAGGATLLWAALSRQWRASFQFLHPLTIAVFCATSLPWYILCALRNPDFLRVFIWQHNFERYLTPVFQHRQPFYFYVPILAMASIPWIVTNIALLYTKGKRDEWQTSPGIFILCWSFFPFLFFSFSQSKLPGYILPTIPPLFLLMSRAVARLFAQSGRGFVIGVGITAAIFPVIAALSVRVLTRIGHTFNVPNSHVIGLLILLGGGGLVAIAFIVARKPMAALASVALSMGALVAFMNIEILPQADSRISARKAANECMRIDQSCNKVAVIGLTRDWRYGMNYYFGRELPDWSPGAPLPELLFANERTVSELEHLGYRIHEVSRVSAPFAILIRVSSSEDPAR